MKHTQRTTKLCSGLFAFIALFALVAGPAAVAEESPATKQPASGFSFDVYGDSCSIMCLHYYPAYMSDATMSLVDMLQLVLLAKVALEFFKKDLILIYYPVTKELTHFIMPFMTRSEVSYMTLDRGWVTEAAVEAV